MIKKKKFLFEEDTKSKTSIALHVSNDELKTKASPEKKGSISLGGTNGQKKFIVRSFGFSVVGGIKPDGTRFTKKDIGKSAANVLQYINREDSVTDIQTDENNSLVYDSTHQLSDQELNDLRKEFQKGLEGMHHLMISTGQDLSRDETIEMTRQTMARFKEETGKTFDYQFAYHTDKSINEETGKRENNHVHILIEGSKNDVKFSPVQLEKLKQISMEETIKILDRQNKNHHLENQYNYSSENINKLEKAEQIQDRFYKEINHIQDKEQAELKIAFQKYSEDLSLTRADFETMKEIQKTKGIASHLERNHDDIATKEITRLETQKYQILERMSEHGFENLKLVPEDSFSKLEKFQYAQNAYEKAYKDNFDSEEGERRRQEHGDSAEYKLAKEKLDSLTKKLSEDEKELFQSITPKEFFDYKNLKENIEPELDRLSRMTQKEIGDEKLSNATESISSIKKEYSEDEKIIQEKFQKSIDSFLKSPEAQAIHEKYRQERIDTAKEFGKEMGEATGWKNQKQKFMEREDNRDRDKEDVKKESERSLWDKMFKEHTQKERTIEFSVDAAIDSKIKTTDTLQDDLNRLKMKIEDKPSLTPEQEEKRLEKLKDIKDDYKEQSKRLKEEESLTLKIEFLKDTEKSPFKKEDIETFREILKAENQVKYLEKNYDSIAEKEISSKEKALNTMSQKIDSDVLRTLKSLDDGERESLNKYMAAKAYSEKIHKDILAPEDKLKKADSWLANETKKLSPEQKESFDKITSKDVFLYSKTVEIDTELSRLKGMNRDQIADEKISEAKNNLAEIEGKLTVSKDVFLREVELFSKSSQAEQIHQDFQEKRIQLAKETSITMKDETGLDKTADSFMKHEREKINNSEAKFSTNDGISARLKSVDELEDSLYRLKSGLGDKVLSEDKEALEVLKSQTRSSNNIDFNMKEMIEQSKAIAKERNDAKALDGEESMAFRDAQKSFMNFKFVMNDGLNLEDLKGWKDEATGKGLTEAEKEAIMKKDPKKVFISEENADQFIKNVSDQAIKLKEAGIFNDEYKFHDQRAKEILFENHNKDIATIAKINIDDYEKQGFNVDKLKDKLVDLSKEEEKIKNMRAEKSISEAIDSLPKEQKHKDTDNNKNAFKQ